MDKASMWGSRSLDPGALARFEFAMIVPAAIRRKAQRAGSRPNFPWLARRRGRALHSVGERIQADLEMARCLQFTIGEACARERSPLAGALRFSKGDINA
jgi:hypothetical protein